MKKFDPISQHCEQIENFFLRNIIKLYLGFNYLCVLTTKLVKKKELALIDGYFALFAAISANKHKNLDSDIPSGRSTAILLRLER